MDKKYNLGDLRQRQSLSLRSKILLTKKRIREFYEHFNGDVCVSFSGGKDSTVLLHIARSIYPDIKAVYCDTGLEFPEVKAHVKTFDNVEIIRPKLSFREVIDKYGWVFPSKEVSQYIYAAKNGAKWGIQCLKGETFDGVPHPYRQRFVRWAGLVDAPFKISDKCCYHMKKSPLHTFGKKNKSFAIIGTLATESKLRENRWLEYGCNAYDAKEPSSKPLSVWTEQDILQYIKENNVPIPSVYGDIVEKDGKLITTGETRTGCIFCPIGCHLEKGDKRRFVRLKQTHPQLYKYCMEQLGMREVLDYIHDYCHCKEELY